MSNNESCWTCGQMREHKFLAVVSGDEIVFSLNQLFYNNDRLFSERRAVDWIEQGNTPEYLGLCCRKKDVRLPNCTVYDNNNNREREGESHIIKYKVWDTLKEIFLEEHEYLITSIGTVLYCGEDEEDRWEDESNRFLVVSYTGVNDVDKQPIYEYSIIRCKNRETQKYELLKVGFVNGCFTYGTCNFHEYFRLYESPRVIGNLLQNAYLLENQDE